MSADLAKKQADCKPTFVNFILLHGILMVLSWGFFLQWGAFIARYFRHKDPTWFHLHRFFQVSCCSQMLHKFCSAIVEFCTLGLNCTVSFFDLVILPSFILKVWSHLTSLARFIKTTCFCLALCLWKMGYNPFCPLFRLSSLTQC